MFLFCFNCRMAFPRILLLVLSFGLLTQGTFPARAEEPDFWKAQQNIRKLIGARDIGTLASSPASDSVHSDPQAAMERFLILFLAGYDDEAAGFLSVLQKQEKQLGTHALSQLADELIRRERWDLVRKYLEALPTAEPGWGYVFLRKWNERATPEEIDLWLDQRAATAPSYWSREHFRLATLQKRQSLLVDAYRKRLKANPRDHSAALQLASGYEKTSDSPFIDWLADLYQPACPSDAFEISRALQGPQFALTLRFLEKARDLPFGEADIAYMKKRESQGQRLSLQPVDHEKDFRGMVRYEMMTVYQESGQGAEAQKLLEQIAAEYPGGIPTGLMGAAGQIQAASGARVIEGRILDAEKKPENQNTPEYWKSRGEYYRGRKEYEKALEAFNKVLSMTTVPETAEPVRGKGNGGEGQMRYWALGDASRCLQELGKNREAFALFHQDLAQWPPNHQLAGHIANSLASDFNRDGGHLVKPDDEVLWTWLTARRDWSHGAERLLREMSENAAPEEKAAFWDRVQTLALKDPEHSAIAGWVMLNQGEKDRALICLKSALKSLPAGEKRENAAATLFGLYRDSSDWKNAALVLPEAAAQYNYAEFAERYSDLAECAAQSGYPKESIRFWARARDYDRCSGGSLDNLLKAGMKKELIEYYRNLIRKEPACVTAGEYLKQAENDPG